MKVANVTSVQPGTEAGYVEIAGGRLYVETSGSGRPLVMLHAGIADASMWDDQWAAFAERYRVMRFDLRGFGRSPSPPATFAPHRDLRDLLVAQGGEQAYLLGASLGGRIAIDVALAWPEMVAGLVLAAPSIGGYALSDALDAAEAEIEAAIAAGDYDRAAEIDLRTWFDGPRRQPEQVDPALRARAFALARRVYETAAANGGPGRFEPLDPPAIARLERIVAPTLVIVGAEDQPDMRAIADLLVARIGDATLVALPGAAHLPNMEQPEEFNAQVLGFFDRLDRSAVELRDLTIDNWEECARLTIAPEQAGLVDANAWSLAEARYHTWMLPQAIYHGATMVGFTMFSITPDPREGRHWVHRFMIDQRYQGRGFGRAGMRAVVRRMAAIPGCDEIWIGYDRRNAAAAALYHSLGFVETGPAPWEGNDLAAVRRLSPRAAAVP